MIEKSGRFRGASERDCLDLRELNRSSGPLAFDVRLDR